MKSLPRNIIIGLVGIVLLALFARYVLFKDTFEQWGAGLERIETWQENYKRDNPNATKEEMDAAFEASITSLKVWQEKYKQQHPNATQVEIDAAFNAQFSGKKTE